MLSREIIRRSWIKLAATENSLNSQTCLITLYIYTNTRGRFKELVVIIDYTIVGWVMIQTIVFESLLT